MPPSKGKKKKQPAASPSCRSSCDTASGNVEGCVDLQSIAAAAAARFPALVPRDGAGCLAGTVAKVSPRGGSGGGGGAGLGRLWLSEAAMIGAKMRPGCLVAVSLISSRSDKLDGFPLADLFEECNKFFYVDVDNDLMYGEAGRHFVVATVFPSREVQNNSIMLSWDVACVLGDPSAGRSLFISPIYTRQTSKHSRDVDTLCIIKCKNLYLSLAPPEVVSSTGIESESDCYPERNRMAMETSKQTPSIPLWRKESNDFASKSGSSICLDPSTARSALADEKVNEFLQTAAIRWLNARYLLKGNFVPIPMCGKVSLFVAMGPELDSSARDDLYEKGIMLSNTEHSANLGQALVLFLVDRTTKVYLSDSVCTDTLGSDKPNLPSTLGGLSEESAEIKKIISFSLADTGLSRFCNMSIVFRYKGILLFGPPGTGKTSLASSCTYDTGANLFTINGPEIISNHYGESEQALCDVFSSAKKAAPAVIFIDELDAIAPSRKDGGEGLSIRIVGTLLKLMDEIRPSDRVLLIAATNRPDSIDCALRCHGRLDKEIEIGVPSPGQRMDILHHLLVGVHHSLTCKELESIVLETHGFVGADLAALCNEAALCALRRYISRKENSTQQLTMPSIDVVGTKGSFNESSESCDEKDETILQVTKDDFKKAKKKVRPSAMREVMLEVPKVCWEDVGGQASVKEQLIEVIQWSPEGFKRLGFQPPKGVLMIGPPGCSKTLMARAAASEAKLNFLAVKGPELFSKWVGDSEKAVRSLFAKARANAPAIIFFDEIDGLAITRENDSSNVADRVVSQLLVEMDGLDQDTRITVIAATNRPDKIDRALMRPGRFDRLLNVQPPNEADRVDIFRIHTRRMPCSTDVNLNELARLTEGYTGADIKLVCREASIEALDEDFEIEEVAMRHFKSAINRIKPQDVSFYQKLATDFQRSVI